MLKSWILMTPTPWLGFWCSKVLNFRNLDVLDNLHIKESSIPPQKHAWQAFKENNSITHMIQYIIIRTVFLYIFVFSFSKVRMSLQRWIWIVLQSDNTFFGASFTMETRHCMRFSHLWNMWKTTSGSTSGRVDHALAHRHNRSQLRSSLRESNFAKRACTTIRTKAAYRTSEHLARRKTHPEPSDWMVWQNWPEGGMTGKLHVPYNSIDTYRPSACRVAGPWPLWSLCDQHKDPNLSTWNCNSLYLCEPAAHWNSVSSNITGPALHTLRLLLQ